MAQTAVSCDGSCIYSKFLKTFLFAFVVQLVFSCSALLTFNFSLAFKHFHFPKFHNSQTSGFVIILNPVVLKNVATSFDKVTKIYALSGSILLIPKSSGSLGPPIMEPLLQTLTVYFYSGIIGSFFEDFVSEYQAMGTFLFIFKNGYSVVPNI